MAKNDKDRLGHERLVQEKAATATFCMVRCMEAWLQHTAHLDPAAPLFPRDDGKHMRSGTPRGRLTYWLNIIGEPDVKAFGFHSLRAGGATAAAKAGVPVHLIKQHGNWSSDAVYAYIRPDTAERISASAAMGPQENVASPLYAPPGAVFTFLPRSKWAAAAK